MPSPFNPESVLVCLDQVKVACLRPCPTHGFHGVHPELPGVEYGDGFDLRSRTVESNSRHSRVEFSRNAEAMYFCGAERRRNDCCRWRAACPTYTQMLLGVLMNRGWNATISC